MIKTFYIFTHSIFSFLGPAAPLVAAAANGGAIGRADGGETPGDITEYLLRHENSASFHPSGLLHTEGAGRTDNINTNVPAGAYVIPADVVSGLGEGNTLAGASVIDRMMGTAPYGIKKPDLKEGRSLPRAPMPHVDVPDPLQAVRESGFASGGAPAVFNPIDPSKMPSNGIIPSSLPTKGSTQGNLLNAMQGNSRGGQAHDGDGDKVPVVLAGGEYVIHPKDIEGKFGSLKHGHDILDKWVVLQRNKIANEMKRLPPPVGVKKS